MTLRSLSTRLSLWHGLACLLVCGLFAVGTYLWLHVYMINGVAELMERRAAQIAALWRLREYAAEENDAITEIKYSYAPEKNDRFVRITNGQGRVLYMSGPPADGSFSPAGIPSFGGKGDAMVRELPEQEMIIAGQRFSHGGDSYLVEVGTSLRPVKRVLRAYVGMLLAGAPLVLLIAVGGGFILVQKSLRPVREISAAAQQLTYGDPRMRLPISRSGDELEHLSTVLNEMLARLEAAFVVSQRFGALASHELRTPLTIIIGELELVLREKNLSPQSRELLESSFDEAARLMKIVEGLFAIARLEAGEAHLESVPFDFSALVETTAEQMSLLAEDKGVTVVCDLEPHLTYVGDKARIKQVIVNILDNAIKYSRPGGEVILRIHRSAGMLEFRVADNGPGVSEEVLPHIFESFYRGDDDATRRVDGAGLGLSIVKSICSAHGGTVAAANRSSGGFEVSVRLPLQAK